MVERAAEETSEPEDAAFAHGSLGRLAPAWWEPAEGEPEPEPWLTPDAALDRFLDWTAARGMAFPLSYHSRRLPSMRCRKRSPGRRRALRARAGAADSRYVPRNSQFIYRRNRLFMLYFQEVDDIVYF